ncbi:hypothetical protein KEF85_08060 [Methylomonas paludis]|uniref:Uncharacterized protein n=1 Tax=Methylomonas paludis TaxID=1173101 RepID=A0A975MRU7_9GAMM|nr:hypothetical protein [Methylomonas paludis]QWF72386.1 hypothetical protein KEF85_08060 [Methylomonas paludis]
MQYFTPSVEGLARAGYTHGLKISAQGLDKRFTQEACELMKRVLETALAQVVTRFFAPTAFKVFSVN